MGLFRNYEGKIIETTDENARSMGYEPYTVDERAADLEQQGVQEGIADRAEGLGTTFLRGVGSGVTLGGLDVLTGAMVSDNQREDIVAGMEAHPIARTGGEIIGSLLPIMPGAGVLAKTPAGILSQQTAKIAEGGGTKAILHAAGTEGAVQNVGQYIGHAALEDKDVTAEGIAGAAGLGYGFGAAGGGVALGVEKGTIAARRMFSRVMDGGKDAAATVAREWETKSREILDANEATANAARKKLEDLKAARRAAQEEHLRAKTNLVDEQARARRGTPAPPKPTDTPMEFTPDGPIPDLGAELPGPRRTPKVDTSEPFTYPENMSVGEAPPTPTAAELGDEAFMPPPQPPENFGPSEPELFSPGRPTPLEEARISANRGTVGMQPTAKVDEYLAKWRAKQNAPAAAEQPNGLLYEVKREGRKYVTGDGRTLERNQLDDAVNAVLPDGFKAGGNVDPWNVKVHRGMPAGAPEKNTIYVLKPNELESRGLFGNELKEGGVDSIKDAWKQGKRLEPIEIDVAPNGKLYIEDGNHRLSAAVDEGRDIAVRFRETPKDWQPQAGARAINDRLGGSVAGETAKTGVDVFSEAADFGQPWVARKQSVAGLSNVRGAFGKLAREVQLPRTAFDDEIEKLEEVLTAFDRTRPALMENLGKADTRGLQPLARDPRLAEDLQRWQERGDQFADRATQEVGAADRQVGADFKTGAGTPNKLREIESQLDDALEAASNAATDAEREAALGEARLLEAQLNSESLPDNLIGDVAKAAENFNQYEKASADLADAMGDAAHPLSAEHAKEWAKANDEAVRKTTDRMTRSIEDAETFDVAKMTPKERVAHARQYKAETGAEFTRAKEAEAIGREEAQAANKDLNAARKRLNAERKELFPKKKAGVGAEAAGLYEMMDIPGMPKASDLPVVGPLLSAYLKYRTAKAALGRFTGRIPATADARAAALAAKTKDKIATSVDRALGFGTKVASKGRKPIATASVMVNRVLAERIFDNGEPAPNSKDIRELGTARLRELSAYVTTPGAIEKDVRRELQGVTDPDLIAAAEKHRRATMQYLLDKAPKEPEPDPLTPVQSKWRMSALDALSFGRRLAVIHDPASAFEATANGTLTTEAAETLRDAFPRLFALGQQRLLMKAGELKEAVPYRTKVMMSMLYDVPLDRSLDPRNIRIMQSVYTPAPAQMPQAMGNSAPPAPSVAGDVTVNALYQTASDRAALRR